MKLFITTPMTLCIEGEDMLEVANNYWAAVPECCVSDNQFLLSAGCSKYENDQTSEFLDAYQYITDGMDEEEIAEYVATHPEVKNSKLYKGEFDG